MEKTISITIGRSIFMIEEDAYDRLVRYLESLQGHFASFADHQEILNDIESRIAEKFSELISKGKRQAVNLADVDEVMSSMGQAEDLSGEGKADRKEGGDGESNEAAKRLYRNGDDVVIAGVASGLAAYFGIDAVVVRLIFILLTVFGGGSGILIYIILWVITPEAKTASERLEMRGNPVTVAKIEKNIKEALDKSKVNKTEIRRFANRFTQFLRRALVLLGQIAAKVVPVIGVVLGVILLLVGVLSIFGVCFAAAAAIFNFDSPYFNVPVLIQYGGTALYNVAIVAVGLVALVPLLFVFLLGATLASRKNSFNVFLTSFLLVVWMVAIIAVGVLSLRFAPEIQGQVEEMKSVPAVEERRSHSLDDFDRIHADGIDELIVRQGERFAVSSEGASADLQKLNLDVKDGELRIIRNDSAMFVGQDRAARVVVSMPELKNLRLDGLVKAKVEGFKQANMFLDLGGASKAELGVDISDRLVVKMDGLSELVASGSARVSEVVLGGSSEYDASSLVSGYGTFRLEGTAKAKVNASDYIRIETFGLSHAYYSGSAKVEAFARDMSRIEAR